MRYKIYLLLLVSFYSYNFFAQTTEKVSASEIKRDTNVEFEKVIKQLYPNAILNKLENLEGYTHSYQIIIEQLLDHKNPKKGTFKHYLYLSHFDFNKPMVIETEGYKARYVKNEVSSLLNANQLIVEYRFYGKSRPKDIPWEYLSIEQAVEDYHNIVKAFKKLYKGKWISTGISKGGTSTLAYKATYPNDVDVAMPYVAPMNNTQEDVRTVNHYVNQVGTKECRDKVIEFQRALLNRRVELEKEFENYASNSKMMFNEVSIPEALEYAVLEFPFSFWQWDGKCEEIPSSTGSAKELFDFMNRSVGVGVYSDSGYQELLPSFYEHEKQLGYYGFNFEPVKDLLKIVKNTSNKRFAPKNVSLDYDPTFMNKARSVIENSSEKILFIYGGLDTWVSCAPNPKPTLNVLKMVLPTGTHATRVKHFSAVEQVKILDTLNNWLK
ncbi:MAG: S28 family serine protease [Limnohabitans sp.]|nr:S28 family serine protease [Limnohabitans sp.]